MLYRRGQASLAATISLLGLLTGCGSDAAQTSSPITTPGQSTHPAKITFSDNGGPSGTSVYVMNPDGSGVTRIAAGHNPAISPDGSKLALEQSGLTLMNPDGTNPEQLAADGSDPAFSSDSTRIAFVCDRSICVIDTDGTDRKTLTESLGERLTYPQNPAFSPDGSTIVFNLKGAIWTVNTDGTALRPLLTDDSNTTAVFTPDGTGIVFASRRGGNDRTETYVMATDGTDIRPLTGEGTALPSPDPYYATTLPAFSPDGTRLLVTRWTQDSAKVVTGAQIWVMNPDGSEPRQLTASNQAARAASWGGNSTA